MDVEEHVVSESFIGRAAGVAVPSIFSTVAQLLALQSGVGVIEPVNINHSEANLAILNCFLPADAGADETEKHSAVRKTLEAGFMGSSLFRNRGKTLLR